MTNEEAIEVLKNDIEICTIQQKQACEMAIKVLESQLQFYPPCINCNTKMDEIRRIYDNLPSVTPERPKGKWIDGYCSECGKSCLCDGWGIDIESKYCPKCGAEMSGGEEDEVSD